MIKKPVSIILSTDKNIAKLNAYLEELQARCSMRTLTAENIVNILDNVEKRIGVPKKYLEGTKVDYTGAEVLPRSYRFYCESTHFNAYHDGKHWHITFIGRLKCPRRKNNTSVELSELTKKAIVREISSMEV